jgi:hypothetical protein
METAMRKTHALVLAGAAALALGGAAVAWGSADRDTHDMTVTLPGGAVGHIHYSGDVAPTLVIDDNHFAFDPLWPSPAAMALDPDFAALDAWSMDFDRMIERMFADARRMARLAEPDETLTQAATRGVLPGSYSYSFVSTTSKGKTCAQMVQVTAPASGGKPEVVRQTSGDCAPAKDDSIKADAPPAPKTVPTKDTT